MEYTIITCQYCDVLKSTITCPQCSDHLLGGTQCCMQNAAPVLSVGECNHLTLVLKNTAPFHRVRDLNHLSTMLQNATSVLCVGEYNHLSPVL